MTDEEIFNEFTAADPNLGPRLDLATVDPWWRGRLGFCASNARSLLRNAGATAEKMPSVHFDFVDNKDINACAFRHRGRYFIGMNSGSVVYLHTLFSRLLSNPRVLPAVGDITREDEARVAPVPIRHGRVHESSQFAPIIPNDPARQFHYEYLNVVALGFLMSHEITHILHGHVAYCEERLGYRGISESRWHTGEPSAAMTRQTLEMDADIGASVAQAGTALTLATSPEGRPSGELARFYRTPQEAMYHFAFGICPFFRMFGDDPVPVADAEVGTYPPWRVRQMIAIASAAYFISRRWNHELALSCQQAMREAILEVEPAYCRTTGEPMATQGLTEAFDGTGWRYVEGTLIAHWRERLYDELLPFSFIELPEA